MYIIYSADMFLLNLENAPTQKNTRILGVLFMLLQTHTQSEKLVLLHSYRAYQYTSSIDASAQREHPTFFQETLSIVVVVVVMLTNVTKQKEPSVSLKCVRYIIIQRRRRCCGGYITDQKANIIPDELFFLPDRYIAYKNLS